MKKSVFAAAAAFLLASVPAAAHHGAGVFDADRSVTVAGTVTQFHFVNPHVLVYVAVAGDDGAEVEWAGELTSPNRLARSGSADVKWHRDILQPGDRITMTGHPARNGAPAMDITRILNADGAPLIGGRD